LQKKLPERDRERYGDAIEEIDSRILHLPFQSTKVSAIDGGIRRELLLRDTLRDTHPPNIPRQKRAPFHARKRHQPKG
jgi:hypothetical protein